MPTHQSTIRMLRFLRHIAGWTMPLLIALPLACSAQTPGRYQIDAPDSRVEVRVFKSGFFGGLADNHVILLKRFSGTADARPDGSWQVHVVGDSGSLQVVDPGASDSTRQQVQRKMLGPMQIDPQRFPTIEIMSRSVTADAAARHWRMLADVTLHGVTRSVEFPLEESEDGGKVHIRGEQQLRLRDFGITPIRLALGTVQVRNEFELLYDVVLEKQ